LFILAKTEIRRAVETTWRQSAETKSNRTADC